MPPEWDSDDPWDLEESTIGSNSRIAVAEPGDIQDDEFEPSDFDAESISKFGSVTSSVYRHAYENGRRYHKYRHGTYPIPNDETEQNREDVKHAAVLELTRGKTVLAPIGDHPQKIIDLGTGTGNWAIEIAELYPSAEVVGCDLSPIQPSWVPSNLRFVIDDIEDDWAHGDNWDLVHIRQVLPALQNPDCVIKQSFSHIRPGGWIEVQDFGGILKSDDGSLPEDSLILEFYAMTVEAFAKRGINWTIANDLREVFEQAGFVNIQCRKLKCPIGVWPKARRLRLVGLYMNSVLADLIDALAPRVFPLLSKSPQQMRDFLPKVHSELQNANSHVYLDYLSWYAQKLGSD